MKEKLSDAYVKQVLELFQYSDFRDRSEKTVVEILLGNYPKSSTPMLLKPADITCEAIDELSTKVTCSWSDYSFFFTMKWKKGGKGNNYILETVL